MRRAVVLGLLLATAHGQEDVRRIRELIADLKSKESIERAIAAEELGKLGRLAKSAAPALVKRLGDEDWWVRRRAAEALGKIGPDSMPALLSALENKDAAVRAGAAEVLDTSLSAYLTVAHLRALAVLLKDADQNAREHAALALGKRGEAGVDFLAPAFLAPEKRTRDAAVLGLITAGSAAVPALTKTLASAPAEEIRADAARALGQMKAVAAGEALLLALADPSPAVAGAAARSLGQAGAAPDKGVPPLLKGLAAGAPAFREGCIDGLAAYGGPAEEGLVAALADPEACEASCLSFLRMGERAVPPLRKALGSESAPARRAALMTIAALGVPLEKDAIKEVADRLADSSGAVREEAARALARLGLKAKDERLKAGAADPDPAVRAAAFFALGELGMDTDAVEDQDPFVRIEAVLARWKNRGGAGAEDLAKAAFDAAAEPRVRAAATTALGAMGIGAAGVDLTPLLGDPSVEVRRAAVRALARITQPAVAAIRESRAATKPNKSVESGLEWLAKKQTSDGTWPSGNLTPGVTGLALLAFLARGYGPAHDRYGITVGKGLDSLLKDPRWNGCLVPTSHHEHLICHGIATQAIVEAYILTGEYRFRRVAQPALDYIVWARNPYLAWRYDPRGGENDTHVTMWMVTALRLGDAAGLRVDAEAYAGAASWIDKMTDLGSGRIGYNYPGGIPARPENLRDQFPPDEVESMTAAGIWCRHLLGGKELKTSEHKKGVELLLAKPPRTSSGAQDHMYWNFGSLGLYQDGDDAYKKWEKAVVAALAACRDETSGAWRPTDAWSTSVGEGNGAYVTAMGVLTLLTPTRYPRAFLTKPKLSVASQSAIAALRKACGDEDAEVRDIAAAACARLSG